MPGLTLTKNLTKTTVVKITAIAGYTDTSGGGYSFMWYGIKIDDLYLNLNELSSDID